MPFSSRRPVDWRAGVFVAANDSRKGVLALVAVAAFTASIARADLLDYNLVADGVYTDSTCSSTIPDATISNNGQTVQLPIGTTSAYITMAIQATINNGSSMPISGDGMAQAILTLQGTTTGNMGNGGLMNCINGAATAYVNNGTLVGSQDCSGDNPGANSGSHGEDWHGGTIAGPTGRPSKPMHSRTNRPPRQSSGLPPSPALVRRTVAARAILSSSGATGGYTSSNLGSAFTALFSPPTGLASTNRVVNYSNAGMPASVGANGSAVVPTYYLQGASGISAQYFTTTLGEVDYQFSNASSGTAILNALPANLSGIFGALNSDFIMGGHEYEASNTLATATSGTASGVVGCGPGVTVSIATPPAIGAISSQSGLQILTGGSTPFAFTVSNSGNAALNFTATSGSNTSGLILGPVNVSPGGVSGPASGLTFSSTTVGPAQTGSFSVSDPNASNSPQTGTVTVNVYDHASPAINGTTIIFPPVHAGYAGTVAACNGASIGNAAGYRVNLKTIGGNASAGGVTLSGDLGCLTPGGAVGTIAATLAPGQPCGAINQSFPLTFADDSALPGASGNLGGTTINVSGVVYSGQSTWSGSGGGSWGTLANNFGANWSGGSPGLDPNFQSSDTATFAGAVASGAATVTLGGASPSLAALAFNNVAASYTLASGSGGTLHMNNGAATATITNAAGSHTIAAPLALDGNASVTVNNAGDTLTISGPVSGGGGLAVSGAGTLMLGGSNSYTGGTAINAGTVVFSTASALAGPAASVTVNAGGVAAAGYPMDQNFLNQLAAGSSGVAALAVSSSNNLSLSGLAGLRLGAAGNATYSGTLAPSGTTYYLGGGGGILTVASPLTGANAVNVGSNGAPPATVILAGNNTYTGPTQVSGGTLVLPADNSSSSFAANNGGTLQFDAATVNLGTRSIQASAGGNVQYLNATINGGYLCGPGTHNFPASFASSLNAVTINPGTVVNQGGNDAFTNVVNRGTLMNSGSLTVVGGINDGGGSLTINGTADVSAWSDAGTINLNSGGVLNNHVSDLTVYGGAESPSPAAAR